MIGTERLILRGWTAADRDALYALCNNPVVMATIGPHQTMAEVEAVIVRQQACLDQHGTCFWAMERRADGAVIGFCGIKPGAEGTPLDGAPEIGWRLDDAFWGQGLAREAAQATLDHHWSTTDAPRIGAITSAGNHRSWGLMERLGMVRDRAQDFDHPAVAQESPLKPHITYWIDRPARTG